MLLFSLYYSTTINTVYTSQCILLEQVVHCKQQKLAVSSLHPCSKSINFGLLLCVINNNRGFSSLHCQNIIITTPPSQFIKFKVILHKQKENVASQFIKFDKVINWKQKEYTDPRYFTLAFLLCYGILKLMNSLQENIWLKEWNYLDKKIIWLLLISLHQFFPQNNLVCPNSKHYFWS